MAETKPQTQRRGAATKTQRGGPEPQRRCVVCRAERATSELVRFAAFDGMLVFGRANSGKSAYICVSQGCLERLTKRAAARGLKQNLAPFDCRSIISRLHQQAEKQLLEAVGLARRQGSLLWGVDAVEGAPTPPGAVLLIACDLAARSRRKLPAVAPFVDGERLGRAAGMGYVGAMQLSSGKIAAHAAYWFRVWYETRPNGGRCEGETAPTQFEVA